MADDYAVEGDVVRYGADRIEDADASSFERLSAHFGRDDRLVFYRSMVLAGADPRTFLALNESYGRDANHAFWGVTTIDADLDLSALQVLGSDHVTDGRLVLHGNTVIEDADRNSFRALSARIAVDGKRVYFDGAPIASADAATFEVLSDEYSRDRRHVFAYHEPVSGALPASFEIISEQWTRDARHVFYRNEVVEGADPASFRRLGDNHALDSMRVYYLSFPLEKADVSSAEILGPYCLRDRKRVFHRATLVEGADRDSFELLNDEFSKDRQRVYYRDQAVPFLEATTVHVLHFGSYSGYVRDRSAAYYFREVRAKRKVTKVKADLATFEALDEDYAKDDKAVYFRGRKIPGGDPASFRLLTMYYAKDKNQVYYSSSWDRFRILEDANAESFLDMGSEYGTDHSTLYHLGRKANDSKTRDDSRIVGFITANPHLRGYWWTDDPEPAGGSFTVLEDGYARDDLFLYHNGLRLEEVDVLTFAILGQGFIKDARHVFWFDVSRRGDVWLFTDSGGWQEGKGGVLHGAKLAGAQPASFVALAHGYAKDSGSCYYRQHLLKGADRETFEVVAEDCARDRAHVFWYEKPVRGAHRDTFEILSTRFARDRAAVYWDGQRITGADARSFEVLRVDHPNHFARDRSRVYNANGHRVIKGLDGGRFRFLNAGYGVDGTSVYSTASERPSTTKDASTFEALTDWLARDKGAVYVDGKEVKRLDPRTVEWLGDVYVRDAAGVYWYDPMEGKLLALQDADPASFRLLEDGYVRDQARIYRGPVLIPADAATAEVLSDGYLRDANWVYYSNLQKFRWTPGFRMMDSGYCADENQVYFNGAPLAGSDPRTFRILSLLDPAKPRPFQTLIAKDARQLYLFHEVQAHLDAATFEVLGHDYTKDANAVFFRHQKIAAADSPSFEALGHGYALDKNRVYFDGREIRSKPGP